MPNALLHLISLLVFGHVGTGKSTLCNTLIGDNTGSSFKESNKPEEETLATEAKEGFFDDVRVSAADSPGQGGSKGKTDEYLVNMSDFLRNNKTVQVLVLVLNYQTGRFDEDLDKIFKLISDFYPGKPWINHVAIVWTRYHPDRTNETEKNARKTIPKIGIKKNVPSATEAELNAIPQYFIDSKQARKAGDPGRTELAHLLAWANTKPPLNTLGVMRVKKGAPIVERRSCEKAGNQWETGYHHGGRRFGFFGPRPYRHVIHQNFTKIFEERLRQEYTSGEPTYTDWNQVRTETSERIVHQYDT